MRRALVAGFACALFACGGASGTALESRSAASSGDPRMSPSAVHRYQGPMPRDSAFGDVSGRGEVLFEDVCGTCHEPGDRGLWGRRFSVGHVVSQIRRGSGRMRPISESRLADAELDPLLAYLASVDAVDLGLSE